MELDNRQFYNIFKDFKHGFIWLFCVAFCLILSTQIHVISKTYSEYISILVSEY